MNQPQAHQYYRDSTSLPPSRSVALARFNTDKHYFTDQQIRRQQAIALQPAMQQAAMQAQQNLADPTSQQQGKSQKPKQQTAESQFKNVPKVPQALKPPTVPGQGSVPGGSLGLLPKNATGSFLGDYGHYINKFYNPWSEAWKEESNDGIETGLKYTGRGAMAVGTTAAALAGGLGLAGIGTTTAIGGTGGAAGTGTGLLGGTLGMGRGFSTLGNLFSRGSNFIRGFGGNATKAAKPPGATGGAWDTAGKVWNWADRAMTADYLGSLVTGSSPIESGLSMFGFGSGSNQAGGVGPSGPADPYSQYDNTPNPSSMWNQSGYGPPPAYGRYNPDNWSNLPSNRFSSALPTKTASVVMQNIPVILPVTQKIASELRAEVISPMPILFLLDKEAARLRGTGRSGRRGRGANPNNNRGVGNTLRAPAAPAVSASPSTYLTDSQLLPRGYSFGQSRLTRSGASSKTVPRDMVDLDNVDPNDIHTPAFTSSTLTSGGSRTPGSGQSTASPPGTRSGQGTSTGGGQSTGGGGGGQSTGGGGGGQSTGGGGGGQSTGGGSQSTGGGSQSTGGGSQSTGGGSQSTGGSGNQGSRNTRNNSPTPIPADPAMDRAKMLGGIGAGAVGGALLSSYFGGGGDAYDENIQVAGPDGRPVPISYYTKSTGSVFSPSSWGKTQYEKDKEVMDAARRLGWVPPTQYGQQGEYYGGGSFGGGTRLPTSLYSMTRWPDPRHYRDMVLNNRGGVQPIQQPQPIAQPANTAGFQNTLI
jgi:hypothetical protein